MSVPPIVSFVGALLAQRAIRVAKKNAKKPSRLRRVAGAVVGTGSAAVLAGTALQYYAAGTTVSPERPAGATKLVTTGPNRLSRNPIYVGLAGLLAANALCRGSAASWLPVAGFVGAVSPQIAAEEEALLARFGAEYARYYRRVPRWLA